MKKNLIIIACLFVLMGCEDKISTINELNSDPTIKLFKNEKEITNGIDSIRLISEKTNLLNLKIKLIDSNNNIQFLKYSITKGKLKVYYKKEVQNNTSLNVDYPSVTISLIPEIEGMNEIEFTITDRFGRSYKTGLKIFSFKNLIPVAKLNVISVENGLSKEFILDASESYDQDNNYEGGISTYKIMIDSVEINTKQPKTKFIFPTSGSYEVGLQVMDNSGAWSSRINKIVQVN